MTKGSDRHGSRSGKELGLQEQRLLALGRLSILLTCTVGTVIRSGIKSVRCPYSLQGNWAR